MKIQVDTVRQAVNLLLDLVIEMQGNSVEIPNDFYWFIPSDCLHETVKPERLTLGSLKDDWQEIEKVVEDPDDSVEYALVWCAAILRALGDPKVRTPINAATLGAKPESA
jgi:hypothetical protein